MKVFSLLLFLSLLSFISPTPPLKTKTKPYKNSLHLKRNLDAGLFNFIRHQNLTLDNRHLSINNQTSKTLDTIRATITYNTNLIKNVTNTVVNKVLDSTVGTAKKILHATKIGLEQVYEKHKANARNAFIHIKRFFTFMFNE